MTIMSPSTFSQRTSRPLCSHHHAQGSSSTSDVNCGPEPYQSSPALIFPVSCLCTGNVSKKPELSLRSHVYAHDNHYLPPSKLFKLSLHWNYPPTNIQQYIYTTTCLSYIWSSLRLALNNITELQFSDQQMEHLKIKIYSFKTFKFHFQYIVISKNISWLTLFPR